MSKGIFGDLKPVKNKRICLGIHFRCRVSFYRNQKGVFNQRVKMTPLKSFSCNCQCREESSDIMCDEEWWAECLNNASLEDLVEMPASPIDGGLYRLKCTVYDDDDFGWAFEPVYEALFYERRYQVESTW